MVTFLKTQVNKARLLMVCLAGLLVINLVALGTASWSSMSRAPIAQGSVESSQLLPTPPAVSATVVAVKEPPVAPKAGSPPTAEVESPQPAQEVATAPVPLPTLPEASPPTPLIAPSATASSSELPVDGLQKAVMSLEPLLAQVREVFSEFPFAASSKSPAAHPQTSPNSEFPSDAGQVFPAQSEKSDPPVLRLVNPSETGGDVHYAVDGKSFSLRPGEYHELPREAARQIDFHRGDDFGYAKQVLREGTYVFSVGKAGWDLAPGKEDTSSDLRRAN